MLCEKLTMPTVQFSSSRRFISTSAGGCPVCRAIWARFRPSSSRRLQVAMKTWSNPMPPWETVPQRSPSIRHSSTMRRRVGAVGQTLEQLGDPAVVGPGRHHVVELGAAGVVGIDVAQHVHAARPRRLDQAERGVDLRPVLLAGGLDVGDLHGDVGLFSDADRLVDRVERASRTRRGCGRSSSRRATTWSSPARSAPRCRSRRSARRRGPSRSRTPRRPWPRRAGAASHSCRRCRPGAPRSPWPRCAGLRGRRSARCSPRADRAQRVEILSEGLPAQIEAGRRCRRPSRARCPAGRDAAVPGRTSTCRRLRSSRPGGSWTPPTGRRSRRGRSASACR